MAYRFTRSLIFGSLLLMTGAGITACATNGNKPAPSKQERARLLVNMANASLMEGDGTGALQTLTAAEGYDSSLPELHHTKALAYFMKHDLPNAVREARIATELAPNYSEANNTYGKLLMESGKLKEAEAPLLKAANDPLSREAYKANTNLGILYYKQGKTFEALVKLNRAAEDNSSAACIAYYYIGHIRLAAGNFKDAIRNYDLASRKLCANFADAHLAIGIAYERSRKYDLARKKYLDIEKAFPDTKVSEQAIERLRYLP